MAERRRSITSDDTEAEQQETATIAINGKVLTCRVVEDGADVHITMGVQLENASEVGILIAKLPAENFNLEIMNGGSPFSVHFPALGEQ